MDENRELWLEHIKKMEGQLTSMWSFILYNKFTDDLNNKLKQEIKSLNIGIKRVREKNNNLWNDNNRLHNINRNLRYDIDTLHKRIGDLNETIKLEKEKNNKKFVKRKRDEDTWFNEVKSKKPKIYESMLEEERDKKLLEEFSKLSCIGDIIKLKDTDLLYDFLESEKFSKIYKLIPCLEKLDKMIGMKKLKDQIFSMICYCLHQMNSNEDLNHIVIMGPPGTGKTTVAHLLGEIYQSLGFLSNNTFIKARRSDLIAEYLGQTAVKTQKLLDKAEGGVLFIDEVYSLGNPEKRDSFAKECIDTINQNLTEKANNLLVIIAGYKEEVKQCFFSYNPGLERRFPLQFTIDKYDGDELYQILLKTITLENWSLNEKLNVYLHKEIKENYKLFEYMGGDMQILFKFAKENYSRRLMKTLLTLDSPKELVEEDFKYAIDRFKSNREKKDKIPDYLKRMYV